MTIPINRFTIREQLGKTLLIAELSDFGRGPVLEPIYPELPGLPQRQGITVLGHTGEVVYYLAERKVHDGDLDLYVLKPTRESIASVPKAANTEVMLFND